MVSAQSLPKLPSVSLELRGKGQILHAILNTPKTYNSFDDQRCKAILISAPSVSLAEVSASLRQTRCAFSDRPRICRLQALTDCLPPAGPHRRLELGRDKQRCEGCCIVSDLAASYAVGSADTKIQVGHGQVLLLRRRTLAGTPRRSHERQAPE